MATSSGAAVAYVREGYTNLRIGMFLEVATTLGALLGAHLSSHVSSGAMALILGVVLLLSAGFSMRPRTDSGSPPTSHGLAHRLKLEGEYPTPDGPASYQARRVPLGFTLMALAGTVSGLLGIGSGALKVVAMDLAMGLPFKVSTTTSNFMIGVTAAASAGIYLRHGYIAPLLVAPVMLGVLSGSFLGSRILGQARSETLRKVFAVVVVVLAVEMMYKGLTGRL